MQIVEKALYRLSKDQREVLVLSRYEGLKYKEFARKNENDEQREERLLKEKLRKDALDVRNNMLEPMRKDLKNQCFFKRLDCLV